MPLTAQQQTFLDDYVRKHSVKGRGKKARAKVFETARARVVSALTTLPQASPQFAAIQQAMAAADTTAEQLKFKAAATQMDAVLASIQQAVAAFDPLPLLQGLDGKVTPIRDKARAALPALPALTGFMAPTGSAALRAACTAAVQAAPVLGPGADVKTWAPLMRAHIDAQTLHVAACEQALEQSRTSLLLVRPSLAGAARDLGEFNTTVKDVAKACASRAQRTALNDLLLRMKAEVHDDATLAPLKNPADTKQFADYAALSAPIEAERTALQQAADALKAQLVQWRQALAATLTQGQQGRDLPDVANAGADLPDLVKQTLATEQADMSTGAASAKGTKTAGRRTDGVVQFDPAAYFAAKPPVPYVAPAAGAQPDAARIASFNTAAAAQMKSFLQGPGAALGAEEKFSLSLKSPAQLGNAYAVAQGWNPKKLTADQKAVCAAVGAGMFESVRAATPDKLALQGANPQLTLGGKTYGTPQLLGQGGMGRAMRYTDPTDGSSVVVKTLLVQNEKNRADLVKEVETQRYLMGGDDNAIGRNNVVGVQSAVTDEDGNLHVVMEVVAGGDLEDNRMGMMVAAQLDALPEEARSALQQATIKQAVEGLIYLRDQNVVHFDIKGANIFLAEDGTAKLADFGSSKVGTADDGATTWNTPSTPGYDGGGQQMGEASDERFDTYAMGKVIQVMQTNAADPGRKPPGQLTGAIKRLTEAMTATAADQRPTLEAVLESSYLKNLDSYDPADIQALQAKSVAYAAALRKEMPAVRASGSPVVLAAAAEWNRKTPATVGFTEVCNYCRDQIRKAETATAPLIAQRDTAGIGNQERIDLQVKIDAQRATMQLMNDMLAQFGQSAEAQQLAAEMKALSARLTRGPADAAEDKGTFDAFALVLKGAGDDPAGFLSVVTEAANARLIKQSGVDLKTLTDLASGFQMNVSADNANAPAQVATLKRDIDTFLAALPAQASAWHDPLAAGLGAVLASVQQRLQAATQKQDERAFSALCAELRAASTNPVDFHKAVGQASTAAVLARAGIDPAALLGLAGDLLPPNGDVPVSATQLDALTVRVREYVGSMLKNVQIKDLSREITAGLVNGVKRLREASQLKV